MSAPTPAHCRLIVPLLQARDGDRTRIELSGGRALDVVNIAWGVDLGDEYEHVTANISPRTDAATVDLFFTDEVARILEPDGGLLLWETDGIANVR